MSEITTLAAITVALDPEDLADIERFHEEALNSFTVAARDGSLRSAYAEAASVRRSYERWLVNKIEENDDAMKDTTFLEEELERLADSEYTINRWGTRPNVGDLELIRSEELPRWADMGWTVDEWETGNQRNPDAPKDHSEDTIVITDEWLAEMAEGGPDLCKVVEHRFDSKEAAQSFVNRIRKSWSAGDHDKEVISCSVQHGTAEPFVAVVLEADGNWEHRKALAAARDAHVVNALRKVERCETRSDLNHIARIAKRYSRDMQVLNEGRTFDGGSIRNGRHTGRRIGIGFNYVRFARVMNAIADRAAELGLEGFRTYKVNEFAPRTLTDGDAMDVGCRVGEFLAENEVDHGLNEVTLWSLREGTWKPSFACEQRLHEAGPVGFVARPWWAIASDVNSWLVSKAA